MRHRSGSAQQVPAWSHDFGTLRKGESPDTEHNDNRASPGSHFDLDGWTLLVEEQRLLIARAAGVDPARVRIRIGH